MDEERESIFGARAFAIVVVVVVVHVCQRDYIVRGNVICE